jgi:hypothetical protein
LEPGASPADGNIPFQQSEWIRAHDPADRVLWEVPLAGHCGAVNAAGQEFTTRVLGWFTSHDSGYSRVLYAMQTTPTHSRNSPSEPFIASFTVQGKTLDSLPNQFGNLIC